MYQLEYLESVVKDDITKLSKTNQNRLKKVIEERLAKDPIRFGKPLQYSFKGCRSLRAGHYRIIFKLQAKVILIVKIGHRKEIYKLK